MSIELPTSIRKLLWDADPYALDQEAHQQLIIERVLNYGTLVDWRWLVARYGVNSIRASLETRSPFPRNAIRSEARMLASLIIR
ncbi:MAG: hypothetical protein U1C12_00270 [Patescibacteria group bacterium]|nr:hypothetical protein [Patescibacteria group bacterium]